MAHGFWVFGYGSLLWNPGFAPVITRLAVLRGYQRSFCMWSVHHRGTPELPGLVLALDRSERDQCLGLMLKVADKEASSVLSELRRRELVSDAYREIKVTAERLDGGGTLSALTYIVDRDHRQYCCLTLKQQAQIIARATGGRGANSDYLERTVSRLNELGIGDSDLDSLLREVRLLKASSEP